MKVLIVKTSSLGDIVHTMPAVYDAAANIKKIEFHWVVEESFQSLVKMNPKVTSVIPIALRRWRKKPLKAIRSGEFRTFLTQLRQTNYAYIIDAQGLLKSAWVARVAKGESYGYDRLSIREPLASFFYRQRFQISKDQHAIERIRQLFALTLNYSIPEHEPRYDLSPVISDASRRYIVFLHGTTRDSKMWPQRHWQKLASKFIAAGYQILLPWGNQQEYTAAKAIAQNDSGITVLERSEIDKLAHIIGGSQAVVSVDTGLGHMAAALGVPTIGLYGPTDPLKVGMRGPYVAFAKLDDEDVGSIFTTTAELIQSRVSQQVELLA